MQGILKDKYISRELVENERKNIEITILKEYLRPSWNWWKKLTEEQIEYVHELHKFLPTETIVIYQCIHIESWCLVHGEFTKDDAK